MGRVFASREAGHNSLRRWALAVRGRSRMGAGPDVLPAAVVATRPASVVNSPSGEGIGRGEARTLPAGVPCCPAFPAMPRTRAAAALVLALLTWVAGLSQGVVPPALAATYYVDASSPSCSPSGPGTEFQPYCTITAAVNLRGKAGNTIIVKPGIYREQVTIRASGAPGDPIVLRAEGPGVIVEGADDLSQAASWVSAGGGVWRAAGVNWKPNQVFVDDVLLQPAADSLAPPPVDRFTWLTGQGLFVNLGGDNPGLRRTLVGARSHNFNMVSRSWITIEGFTALHADSRGIFLQSNCSNVTLIGNTVGFADLSGIALTGGSANVIEGNVSMNNGLHGISLTAGTTGCTVRDNEAFGNADPDVRRANGIYLLAAPANTLYRNRLHNNQDSGLHFGTDANGCVAFNNRSWANGDHGYDHLGATGTTHVNDVSSGNYRDGFSIEGGATGTRLSNCISVNNGILTNDHNLWVEPGSDIGFVSDYNIFWNGSADEPINFLGIEYARIQDYQGVSGQDAHSLQVDPLFSSPAAGDFRLRSGSPAIDAGNSAAAGWPATDAAGQPRVDVPGVPNTGAGPVPYADRGALEYQSSAPVARLTVTPASGPAPLTVTADASASTDADGQVVSYRFDFGDGTIVGPQPSPTAIHTYAGGNRTLAVTVTDGDGMTGTASVTVAIGTSLQAVFRVRPATGNHPLSTIGDASGSSDPGRTIVSYRFDFGDGTTVGPQASPTAAHAYTPGTWNASVTVTNDLGDRATASTPVLVDEIGPGPNWVGNPSWESDTTGWSVENATASRVAGGFDGMRALRVSGAAGTGPFGIEDGPNWVAATPGAGARMRFKAWVRSATGSGSVSLSVRETDALGRQRGPVVQSHPVRLGPDWQRVAVEYLCQAGGSTIDFAILDSPVAAGEEFDVDNVSIHTVTDGSTLTPPGGPGLGTPVVFPNPILDHGSLRFTLGQPGPLKVEIFEITGRVIRTLVNESMALPGQFEYPLDDLSDHGRRIPPGMYFYLVQSAGRTVTGRFLTLR